MDKQMTEDAVMERPVLQDADNTGMELLVWAEALEAQWINRAAQEKQDARSGRLRHRFIRSGDSLE